MAAVPVPLHKARGLQVRYTPLLHLHPGLSWLLGGVKEREAGMGNGEIRTKSKRHPLTHQVGGVLKHAHTLSK
jgi:hypothetical protein